LTVTAYLLLSTSLTVTPQPSLVILVYSKYVKLGIALLTALGLIGTGAQQVGLFDIESEPTSVNCAHDNVEVRDVKVDLNLKGVK
jgi:hypothetical protein